MTHVLITSPTDALTAQQLAAVRSLLESSFAGEFSGHDWQHSLGGTHVILNDADARPIAHASVIQRTIEVDQRAIATGYVEAVAVSPDRRGEGNGTAVMTQAAAIIRRDFEIGALSTGEHHFYERLGWVRWRGPTYVKAAGGAVRTPFDDDGIMVLRFESSHDLDVTLPISCETREGDDW